MIQHSTACLNHWMSTVGTVPQDFAKAWHFTCTDLCVADPVVYHPAPKPIEPWGVMRQNSIVDISQNFLDDLAREQARRTDETVATAIAYLEGLLRRVIARIGAFVEGHEGWQCLSCGYPEPLHSQDCALVEARNYLNERDKQ